MKEGLKKEIREWTTEKQRETKPKSNERWVKQVAQTNERQNELPEETALHEYKDTKKWKQRYTDV